MAGKLVRSRLNMIIQYRGHVKMKKRRKKSKISVCSISTRGKVQVDLKIPIVVQRVQKCNTFFSCMGSSSIASLVTVAGTADAEDVQKNIAIFTVTFEHRYENETCSACPKNQHDIWHVIASQTITFELTHKQSGQTKRAHPVLMGSHPYNV